MEILRLNTSNWEPDEIIQGYSSLIWTERFQPTGEFEIHTNKIDETRALIPEGSYITEIQSQEAMIVESHSIEKGSEGAELVTKGRTFECILEERSTIVVNADAGPEEMWTYKADDIWPTDAAKALIMSHLTVSPEAPVQRVPGTAVENLVTSHAGDDNMSFDHKGGELYAEVFRLLQIEAAGIRNQLQNSALKIYIYKGLNRTVNQTSREPVIFRVDMDHIIDPKYVFSIQGYKNVAYVVSEAWQERVYAPGVSSSISGLARRILHVDASDIKTTSSTTRRHKQARAIGLAALAKQNQKTFFDGEVSPDSEYIRGVDYNLGDKVTLMGEYGVSQTMVVNEFVRSEDKNGYERSFPTLIVPSDLEEE